MATADRKPESSAFHKCSICGASFEAESDYLEHLKNHREQQDAARAGVADPKCENPLLAGEQGQTDEERREWRHVQAEDAKEASRDKPR